MCLVELEQRSGFDPQTSSINSMLRDPILSARIISPDYNSHEAALTGMHFQFHLLNNLFNNPVNQWIEITARSIICFNPIWFTEHRVYELGITTL